ncbi:MAG: HD domain-containing phosphohydrolase [Terrimesophilobacter sp.]
MAELPMRGQTEYTPSGVRLAEIVRAMSLAVDLGLGQPWEHVAHACLMACRIAQKLGLAPDERARLFYITMLGWVGCIADSHEVGRWFGDDTRYRSDVYDTDLTPLSFLGFLMQHAGAEGAGASTLHTRGMLVATGGRGVQDWLKTHCEVTGTIATRLGLGAQVADPLRYVFARWDGKGLPKGFGGSDIPLSILLWHLADVVEVHGRRGGVSAAIAVAQARRGTQFSPAVVDAFCDNAEEILGSVEDDPTLDRMIQSDVSLRPILSNAQLDDVLLVIADYADLKSPYFSGHSHGVAQLCATAGRRLGVTGEDAALLRRAALVHDIGRVGVPNTIWDKPGPLSATETDRMRLHPYYTQRVLARPGELARIGELGAMAHERLDGTGYFRGLSGSAIGLPARVLAAANAFRSLQETRAHREALPRNVAATMLVDEARDGRLDADAVDAVLDAAGQPRTRRPHGVADLTGRETEVLILLAGGASNRQIATRLTMAPKTAGNHIEHIYVKIGVRSRAAATFFAMQHGVLPMLPDPAPAHNR